MECLNRRTLLRLCSKGLQYYSKRTITYAVNNNNVLVFRPNSKCEKTANKIWTLYWCSERPRLTARCNVPDLIFYNTKTVDAVVEEDLKVRSVF